jgi:hypothetical protein
MSCRVYVLALRILRRVHNAPSDHIKDDRVASKRAKCVRYLILVSLLVVTFTILMSCGLRTAKRAMYVEAVTLERPVRSLPYAMQ